MYRNQEPTSPPMCRSRKSTSVSTPTTPTRAAATTTPPPTATRSFSASLPSFNHPPATSSTASTSTSNLTSSSLSSIRLSLSDSPVLYPFSELSLSTNSFLSSSSSSSSTPSWRATLRGKQVLIFQRSFRGDPTQIPNRLSSLARSHHSSLARLLGASLPPSPSPSHIYLVYEFVPWAPLHLCLRNPRNPSFTPLPRWSHRLKIASDLAHALDYLHLHCSSLHNHLKSSSVLVSDPPDLSAKLCHFGAADLSGEIPHHLPPDSSAPKPTKRSNSGRMRIQGTRGYIAPEVLSGSPISQRSDVYAFGVVVLELVSGMEPLKYVLEGDRERGEYVRVSAIETAREAIGTEDEDGADGAEERRGRVRRWVDRRLRDSFPVDAAERLVRVALRCVEDEPWMRPDMTWVAGNVSKLYLDSKAWDERMAVPTDFTVSLAPR